jgi:hypothetical protein
MDAYERAAALEQGAQWVHDNNNVPFRADDANNAMLAVMRHNERVQHQAQRQSKAESAAEANESQAQVDETSIYSPTTTARLARAAKVRSAEVQEPDAALTNFSRTHAAVGELNCTTSRNHGGRSFIHF